MSIYDSTNNGFLEPKVVARRKEYPFWSQGDKQCILIYDTVIVLETAYEPLPLDTAHPTISGAILVEETAPTPYNVGWVQYDRVYATIGQGFTTYGISGYQLPGLDSTSAGASVTLTLNGLNIVSYGKYKIAKGYKATLSDASNPVLIVTGTFPAKTISMPRQRNYTIFAGSFTRVAIFSGGVVYGLPFLYVNGQNLYDLTITSAKKYFKRAPKSASLQSKTISEFVYTLNPDDIEVTSPFSVFNSSGQEVDTITDTTSPTASEYVDFINNQGGWIQSEHSTFERWKGNIYLKNTTYVRSS